MQFYVGVFKTEQIQLKNRKPNQSKPEPHLVQMYSDCFLTQPHGLVRFVVFILPTKPNQTAT